MPLSSQIFFSEDIAPKDQFTALFDTTAYALYKALDFANDHGFRYVKILSYEFVGFGHKMTGSYTQEVPHQGRLFTLQDELLTISFLCYKEAPEDRNIIDLEAHRDLLDKVAEGSEDYP
jgi:hypothetical protein